MPQADDVAAAARRVADATRNDERGIEGTPHPDDLVALLPVLDALAAGRGDAERVERWARAICEADGWASDDDWAEFKPNLPPPPPCPAWHTYEPQARAAIALADAERAVALSCRDTNDVV